MHTHWCILIEISKKIMMIKFWNVISDSCVTVLETHFSWVVQTQIRTYVPTFLSACFAFQKFIWCIYNYSIIRIYFWVQIFNKSMIQNSNRIWISAISLGDIYFFHLWLTIFQNRRKYLIAISSELNKYV